MRGVALHVGPEVAPHRAGRGLGRIGGAHDRAPFCDRPLALEHADEHRPGRHELAQVGVERALLVDDVEPRRVLTAELEEAAGDQPQALAFSARQDLADLLFGDGVRLDDRQRSFPHECARSANSATMVAPISAGLRATRTPAASKAAILSAAVPRPPAMIAPACPMRRPFGAVCPATNATTGLVM